MRRLLPITLLSLTLSVSSFATASDGNEVEAPRSFGVVLGCGIAGHSAPTRATCILKRRVLTFANVEISLGVDGQVSFTGERPGYLGGYVIIDYFGESWGAFLEVAMPSIVPPVGSGDRWRLGFTVSF